MQFRRGDAIALVAIPLVVVAFKAEGTILPTICLCLAGAVIVYAIAGHDELSWQRRVAICGLVTVLDLAVVSFPLDAHLGAAQGLELDDALIDLSLGWCNQFDKRRLC